jgi:sodium-dependent dicarboxylate transporter 2/3/5
MAVWWFSEAIPIAATACLPLLLFPLLGVFGQGLVGDAQAAVSPFLDAYIFLFLGGMAIGAAMEEHGLHRRVALHIMRAIGAAPSRLLLGVLCATAFVSMWISNTATAVMMLPIAMALIAQLEAVSGGRRLEQFGCAIMLAVAYAANLGGIGTKIGTGTNSIFAGFVTEKLGYDIGFLEFMAVGAPFVVLFLPLLWWALWRHGRIDAPAAASGRAVLDRELAALGSMSPPEKRVALVFVAAAVLWIASDALRTTLGALLSSGDAPLKIQGKHYEATVAMAAAIALLASRSLSLASLRHLPWGTLLLLGGSFAMAAGIEGSGLSKWLAVQLAILQQLPLLAQLLLTSLSAVLISAVASNTATINLMLNVLPRSMTVLFTATLAASCDFALPAGTPPNAIVFGSGYIRLPTMMRIGIGLDLAAATLLALYGWLYVRLLFP